MRARAARADEHVRADERLKGSRRVAYRYHSVRRCPGVGSRRKGFSSRTAKGRGSSGSTTRYIPQSHDTQHGTCCMSPQRCQSVAAALPTDLCLHEQCRVVVAQLGRLTPATLRAATRGLLRLCHHTVAHHATGTRHFSARQRAARFERRHEARCAVSYGAATVAHAHNTTCDVATAHTATQSTRPSSLDLWGRCNLQRRVRGMRLPSRQRSP